MECAKMQADTELTLTTNQPISLRAFAERWHNLDLLEKSRLLTRLDGWPNMLSEDQDYSPKPSE
jgi:hypothetical protein